MPDPDWLLPAASIPVWVGAHVLVDDGSASGSAICVGLVDPSARYEELGIVYVDGIDVIGVDPGAVSVDLSNPDTFAAARDRLAVAMRLDTDIADGVMFAPGSPGGEWLIGGMKGLRLAHAPTGVFAPSRELALALAWQRVVGA